MACLEDVDKKLSVAVIGGGWAGLSAAIELAARHIPVTVFEAAPHLGGRARAIDWQGHTLDNGQHILLGAYHETLRLMRQVGIDPDRALLRLPLRLSVQGELDLRTPALPAPLHLLAGLLRASGLGMRERFAALRFMSRLKLARFKLAQDTTLQSLLARHRQPPRLTRLLWEPLCLAALNTPLHLASAQVFLNVLRDSFDQARADSDLLLPRVDLSGLFPESAVAYITRQGGEVLTGASVRWIRQNDCGYLIETAESSRHFSHVVAAVSPWRLGDIATQLPEIGHETGTLQYQPICTVYLQYAATARLPFPMLGLAGGHAQWVLDRGALLGHHGLMAVVISAEGAHQTLAHAELAARVIEELRAAFPALGAPFWHKVITEKRATFACLPSLRRPSQQTALPDFHLAGDYTAGDYPATLEGAVRSGVKCAQLISGIP